jgi:AmmeMemoRadiSam system protein B
MSSGEWQMPTGELKINEYLAKKLKKKADIIEEDTLAHTMEHSLEVQLPFILYYSSDVKIVPVVMMGESLETCRLTGEAVADAIKESEDSVSIVASSDEPLCN